MSCQILWEEVRGPLLVQEHCQQMAGHVDGSVMRRKQQQLPCRSDPSWAGSVCNCWSSKAHLCCPSNFWWSPNSNPRFSDWKFCINHVQVYLTWCFPCGSVANQLFSKLMMGCYQIELHQLSITSIPVPHQYIYLNVARMLWVLSVVSHNLMGCLDNLRNCLGVPIKIHDAGSKDLNLSICALPKSACGLGPMKFSRPPLISGLFPLSQVPNTLSHKFGLVELAVTVSDQYIRSCLGSPWI